MASFIGRKALNVAGRPSDRAAQRLGCMPSRSPPAPLTHPLAVSCLPSQLCFLSTWEAPVLARELSLLPSQAFHGSTRRSSLPWMAKMLLVCGLALLENGGLLSFGPPHMYNKLGLLREAPPPPPRMLAQQRSPNSRLSIVMSASSASPTLCEWVLSTCNQVHLAQWASSRLKLSPPNHRRLR